MESCAFLMMKRLREIMVIAIPVAIQTLISVGINLFDSITVGSIGEIEMTAVSQAGQLFFILSLTLAGTTGGANVLIAQYWGKKDRTSIQKVVSTTLKCMLAAVFVVMILAFFFPHQVMSLLSSEQQVRLIGAQYLKAVCISYLFYGISTVIGNLLRAVYTVNIAVIASVVSALVSLSLNYSLVFGLFGLPKCGVIGSAYANIIARFLECLILAVYFLGFEKKIRFRLSMLFQSDALIRRQFIKNVLPVIGNELVWVLGSSVVSVIAGHMALTFTSAYMIYNTLAQMSCALAQGCASAASVLVGMNIGNHQTQNLDPLIKDLKKIGFIVGMLAGLTILILIPVMPLIYRLSDATYDLLIKIMIAGAVIEVFRCMGFVLNVGVLRGGGDAKFVFFNDVAYLWTLCIPLGALCGLVLSVEPALVFILLRGDDVIKAFVGSFRIRQGRWIHDVTVSEEAELSAS